MSDRCCTPITGVSRTNTFVSGFCQGLGGLLGPCLYVVRQTGLVSQLRATEFGEDRAGLLMVFGEVTCWCLRDAWSLAPTGVWSGGCWLGRGGQCADIGAGDGGIPAHAAGDNDMDPAQQRRSDGGSGLTIGEPIVLAAGQMPVTRGHHRVVR